MQLLRNTSGIQMRYLNISAQIGAGGRPLFYGHCQNIGHACIKNKDGNPLQEKTPLPPRMQMTGSQLWNHQIRTRVWGTEPLPIELIWPPDVAGGRDPGRPRLHS